MILLVPRSEERGGRGSGSPLLKGWDSSLESLDQI